MLTLHTVVGAITLEVDYGRDGKSGKWLCPQREQWELGPHQKMTPALVDRICLTVTLTGSYQAASELAGKWGSPVDDSTIHAQVQRMGQKAQAQEQARRQAAAAPAPSTENQKTKRKAPVPEALIIMMDGWMGRQRGEDWGLKPPLGPGERVVWREIKSAVFYRVDQAGVTAGGRGLITQKYVVGFQGEPLEFGRRVQTEARRRGLGQARQVFVVADGSVWIWNIKEDRFQEALGLLDFYHASEHLWAVARALHPEQEESAKAWVEPWLSQLLHGQENGVLQTLHDLPQWCAERGTLLPTAVEKEINYFESHREHLHYETMTARGCPAGSGAMESFCRQLQGRFKRCGQFWTPPGFGRLLALEVARRNLDWDALWSQN